MKGTGFKLLLAALLGSVGSVMAPVSAAEPALSRAQRFYESTQYNDCIQSLNDAAQNSAPELFLKGKCYYMLEEFKKASDALEAAVQTDPHNSEYLDWLGRAYGRRAETSNFFTAPAYASRARQYFEQAFAADPSNLEAADDLFEFYLEAPGIVGGGVDKAIKVAEKIRDAAPARYHSMQARIAEKQKQYSAAEQQLRAAITAAPKAVGRIIDLARFLARRGRISESDALFEQARKVAPQSNQLKFQMAKTYIESNRNLEEARRLLQEYISSSGLTPDDPSRAEADRLLKRIQG